MKIEVCCAYSDEEIFANVEANSKAISKSVQQVSAHDGHAVIVGGAPSLQEKLPLIQKRVALGQTVFALNGACGFLNRNDIIPEYQVILDPNKTMVHYIGEAKEYLFSSQCNPNIFEAKPEATLWHLGIADMLDHIPQEVEADRVTLIGGGLSVGLSSMCLAYGLGFRKLHLFGFDSSYRDDQDHAYDIKTEHRFNQFVPQHDPAIVTVGGKRFRTNLGLARQAQVFPDLCNELIDLGCTITVDADGLIMAVMDEMRRLSASEAA